MGSNNWISTKEALPPVGQVVLAYDDKYDIIGLGELDNINDGWWNFTPSRTVSGSYMTSRISAWCSIPEYKK